MSKKDNLKKKAEACLAKKVDIPMSPLWHMGKAVKFGSDSNLKIMQEAIDYLTCKAQAKMEFNADDKEFLKELYEAFWWGGHYSGLKEAAQLANHYVNGNGVPLRINPEVYKTSKIVIATMSAMKLFIAERKNKRKPFTNIRCDHVEFRQSKYAAPLRRMNYMTEGKMKPSGVLEAAQKNHRLHKTDGHFYLDSFNLVINGGGIKTTWSVKSIYDFEPFEKKDYYTEIPLGDFKLILPDGLSEYMTRIGVAKVFHYSAEWQETWSAVQ
ncbi:hypothetical protein sS8_5078 [Methylocaldum marinum]|uniref:Uncharacterized protein n=1 Tax=Methylocaldum marinum TaxID=1432792 RepID=A0A250L154_9GAMM|nr:hypothetical protein [Methylocaldum marinum]BBA37001.1 hypothetical protein sS8_5078 [Methylocaldum marinum]